MKTVMDLPDLAQFLASAFPQVADIFRIEALTDDGIALRLLVRDEHLRPGNTVSGPAMFALGDVASYLAILSRIGPVALAVTTNATIDFMRKPAPGRDLLADCRILKLGRSLAVCDALIRSDGGHDVVARCSMTYAIPPERGAGRRPGHDIDAT